MSARASRVPRVVVATSNAGKLREIEALLSGSAVELLSLAHGPAVELPEEGTDYATNALAKARAAAHQLGMPALADDSGLEVEALGGAPGPLSARFGGAGLDDAGRVRHLLAALEDVDDAHRGARFVCFAAIAAPDGDEQVVRGVCEGRIRRAACGARGFGYDPVFEPDGEGGRTMAELPAERKNRISHRARAFRALFQTKSWARRVST